MTGPDEHEEEIPFDEAAAAPGPDKEQRRAAKKAAKALKKQAKAARQAAKRARQAAKAEAAASAKAARALARAEARSAEADAKARKAAKAAAKAAKAEAKAATQPTGAVLGADRDTGRPLSPAAAAASAVLEEAAQLMRHAEPEPAVAAAVPSSAPVTHESEVPLEFELDPAPIVDEHEPTPQDDAAEPEPGAGEPTLAEPEPAPVFDAAAEPEPEVEPAPGSGFAREPSEPDAEPDAAAPEPAPEFDAAPAVSTRGPETPGVEVSEPEAPIEFEPEVLAHAEATTPPVAAELEPATEGQSDAVPAAPVPRAWASFTFKEDAPAGDIAQTRSGPSIAPPAGPVAAAIDVGSTSVHLLVGTVDGHRVVPLLDESEFLGLGDRAAADGYFGADVRGALLAALERYVAAARGLGAATITIIGTEPMRRAADAATVIRDVASRLGVAVHVLDHREEGLLTLVGATGGLPVGGQLLLVDIGGGSAEFVIVGRDGAANAVGLPLGAARLTRECVRTDPPSLAEIEALRREVARIVVDAPAAAPVEIVAVGGTASNLLRLLPATAVDRSLTRRRIAVALAMLTVERSEEAAARHLIRPERARILPAGAIIVDAILERYGSDRLRVSEEGMREGLVLATVREGAAWRDRLTTMARGWAEAALQA